MAYPPDVPPSTRSDSTVSAVTHASDHNKITAALRELIAVLGANPAGGYADLTSRLSTIGQDLEAQIGANLLSQTIAYLAADPGIAAAAEAAAGPAVNAKLAESPALPTVAPAPGYSVIILDALNRATWLAANDTDGGPTAHAAALIAAAITPVLEANLDGLARVENAQPFVSGERLAAAILDATGRATWLAARDTDGGPLDVWVDHLRDRLGVIPTEVATQALAPEVTGATPNRKLRVHDRATGRAPVIASTGDPNNPVITGDGWVIFDTITGTKARKADGSGSIVPVSSSLATIAAFGDSLTSEYPGLGITMAETYPALLAADLGVSYYNGGVGGQTTEDIITRQGGIQLALTVANNIIPASGSVDVTVVTPTTVGSASQNGIIGAGTLAGVAGTLSRTTAGVWTFTRTGSGADTPCPPGTPFIVDAAVAQATNVQIIGAGRNDIGLGSTSAIVDRVVGAYVKAVDRLRAQAYAPKFILLGTFTATNEPAGSTGYQRVTGINQQLAELYPDNFVDARRYLIDHGLADAGITPTADDLAKIAADTLPPSLMYDSIHYTENGHLAVKNVVKAAMQSKGWF